MRHVFYIWSVTWWKRGAVFKLKIARTATATPRHWNALTPSRDAIVFFITQSLKRDGGMTTGKVWKPLLLGNGGTFDLFFKSLLQYWFRQARWCTDSRVKKKKSRVSTVIHCSLQRPTTFPPLTSHYVFFRAREGVRRRACDKSIARGEPVSCLCVLYSVLLALNQLCFLRKSTPWLFRY